MCILAQMSVLSPIPNAYFPKALTGRNGSVKWMALLKEKIPANEDEHLTRR